MIWLGQASHKFNQLQLSSQLLAKLWQHYKALGGQVDNMCETTEILPIRRNDEKINKITHLIFRCQPLYTLLLMDVICVANSCIMVELLDMLSQVTWPI